MLKRTGMQWAMIVLILVGVFSVGIVTGWLLPTDLKVMLLEQVLGKFSSILEQSPNQWLLTWNIFLNNLLVAVILLISSLIPLVPLLIIFLNGALIGIFGDLLWRLNYLQPGTFSAAVVGILPHGIVELSAIFFSASLGLLAFLKLVMPHLVEPKLNRRQFILKTLVWFTLVIIPTLLIAGLIEAFISPRVAERFMPESSNEPNAWSVRLDQRQLSHLNCIPQSSTNLSLGMSALPLVYDPEIFSLLQQRSKIGQRESNYRCQDGTWFVISSFAASGWSEADAKDYLLLTLDYIHANVSERITAYGTELATKLDGEKVTYIVTTQDDKTVVILTSGEPEQVTNLLLDVD